MKVIIIGGVAGGATAAARIRRLDEKAEIVILERSGFVSYANCGLPYYIGGVITDPEELTLQTPQGFWNRFRVDVRVRHEATAIDPAGKQVTVKNLETGEVTVEGYDKLLLAPGAAPAPAAWAGQSPAVFPADSGGHVPDSVVCGAEPAQNRGAGRRGLHQPGDGGKFGGDGSGDHDFAADSPADEPAGL